MVKFDFVDKHRLLKNYVFGYSPEKKRYMQYRPASITKSTTKIGDLEDRDADPIRIKPNSTAL